MRGSSKNVLYDKKSNTGLRVKTKDDDKKERETVAEAIRSEFTEAYQGYLQAKNKLGLVCRKRLFIACQQAFKEEFNEDVIEIRVAMNDDLDLHSVKTKNKNFKIGGGESFQYRNFALDNESISEVLADLENFETLPQGTSLLITDTILNT